MPPADKSAGMTIRGGMTVGMREKNTPPPCGHLPFVRGGKL